MAELNGESKMIKIFIPIFLTIGLSMIILLIMQKPLYAIYFGELEIIVILSYMFYELSDMFYKLRNGK